jgi:hypothetical protein
VPTPSQAAADLAARLRELRRGHWPELRLTQGDLAGALSGRKPASVPLISSWEHRTDPQVPPADRLGAYATFFSTRRSVETRPYRLIDEAALTPEERAVREELRRELLDLREAVVTGASASPADRRSIVGRGLWHFPGGARVIIVCPDLPEALRAGLPFADESDPDFTALSRLTDLDALIELFGHIRAVNPDLHVEYRGAARVDSDDSNAHLVLLGGVDWNGVTKLVLEMTEVPVAQISDDDDPNRGCFRVADTPGDLFGPTFTEQENRRILAEDVGHFFRAPNPLNRERSVTVCNGMFSRGVYGAVRTLTDQEFRQRNTDFLTARFAGAQAFSLLFRVRMLQPGVVATPDWTAPDTVLHTWAEEVAS